MPTVRTLLLALLLPMSCLTAAQPAPLFSLPGQNTSVSLEALRGKVVYLDFWASWCDPCRKSFPWMDQLQHKYADKGLVVLAVNLDSKAESADKFLAQHPTSFSIAFDPSGSTPKAYHVKGMPSSFLIDREGNIVSTHIGFQEKDTKSLEQQVVELLGK